MCFLFTNYEIKTEVDSMQDLVGMRVNNIHQIDKDILTIKFYRFGTSKVVIIQNAVRFHITEYPRKKPTTPSDFACRLRKFLRFRRLDDIIQPFSDRAVYFCFGSLYLCIEMFQGGNIVLFNIHDKIIQAVLRYHIISGKTIIGVNQPYNIEQFIEYKKPTTEELHEFLKALEKNDTRLRKVLGKVFPFTRTDFFTHALICAGYEGEIQCKDFVYDEDKVKILESELRKFESFLLDKPKPRPIKYLDKDGTIENPNFEEERKAYMELPPRPIPRGYVYVISNKDMVLSPFKLEQYKDIPCEEFDTFDLACDRYWSVKELQKARKEFNDNENLPQRKVDGVKRNFEKKKKQFTDELELLTNTGRLIIENAEMIEQCRNIINTYISSHTRWDEIRNNIKMYQQEGNELARMIDKVEFEKSSFWVLVNDENFKTHRILIDLKKTAYANGSEYYNKRSTFQKKLEGAISKEEEVLKKVGKDALANKKKLGPMIQEKRKVWWFEKFHWFITSENFLVISGRDKNQNDILVSHYLKPGDIYLHAEIHGAASVVIKNNTKRHVPEISIQQAAEFAVSRSTAWKSNEPCKCFWVYHDQVKKEIQGHQTAQKGAFYIVGQKNYISMTVPQMGVALLFYVSPDHVSKHQHERRIKEEGENLEEEEKKEEPKKYVKPLTTNQLNRELPLGQQEYEEEVPDVPIKIKSLKEVLEEEEDVSDETLMKIAMNAPEDPEAAARREERRAKKNQPKEEKKLDEEVVEAMKEEGIGIDIDVEGINALTGEPVESDEIYSCYATCAPLSAINRYKYKAKIAPGEMKKGKAWPLIQNYFTSIKAPAEHINLIKFIPENDIIGQLPYEVRITLGAGGSAIQNKKKGRKKK